MITLARLRQAVCLAQHRSFHRAAATLQISQPALTKSIQTLEAALGVRLFDRQQGGVVLTEFGELVVEYTVGPWRPRASCCKGSVFWPVSRPGPSSWVGPYPSVISAYGATGNRSRTRSSTFRCWRRTGATSARLVAEKKVDLGVAELARRGPRRVVADGTGWTAPGPLLLPTGPPDSREEPNLSSRPARISLGHPRIPPRPAAAFPRSIGSAGHIDTFNGDFVPAIEVDVPMQLARLTCGGDVSRSGHSQWWKTISMPARWRSFQRPGSTSTRATASSTSGIVRCRQRSRHSCRRSATRRPAAYSGNTSSNAGS